MQKINILIAEDDAIIVENIKRIIKKNDPEANVFSAAVAEVALEYAKKHSIDLFCLDIQLENSDGIELAKIIREIPEYILTPIIFITAIPTKELSAFKETHCYDYIVKPFSEEDLSEKISKILQCSKSKYKAELNQDLRLRFKEKTCVYSVFQKDIICIESQLRRLYITTIHERFTTNIMSLQSLAEKLGSDFFHCHKSFYINQNYIKAIDFSAKEIKLHNDIRIPIGRKYLEQVKEMYDESF